MKAFDGMDKRGGGRLDKVNLDYHDLGYYADDP